jgi:hypothetical protein
MSASIQEAAAQLLSEINAPSGAVNTCVHRDIHGSLILVLIDPHYWHSIAEVPSVFRGYRVVQEKREVTVAFSK